MKAITIHQPWASLIAHGHKRFETRGRITHIRGPIAIHAGKQVNDDAVRMLERDYPHIWREISPLPTGSIVAVADLVECWRSSYIVPTETEKTFGDWTPGRFAWELENVRRIVPIPARGMQGLWNWEVPEDWRCTTCRKTLIGGGICDSCIV